MNDNNLLNYFITQQKQTKDLNASKNTQQLQGAGLQAGGSLLSALYQTKAERENLMQQIEEKALMNALSSKTKSILQAQENQQNALTRLMANYRSALT
jgi:hypothetical protein